MTGTLPMLNPSERPSAASPVHREGAADIVGSLIEMLVGPARVRFGFWDGTSSGPADGVSTVQLRSVDALRRLLWSPGELGIARAFVVGDIDVEGDLFGSRVRDGQKLVAGDHRW